jgi:hypothetical protein
MTATAIIYALLLSGNSDRREAQWKLLGDLGSVAMLAEVERLRAMMEAIDTAVRLPLVELCLPALRRLSPGQFGEFESVINALVAADGQVEIHEYALQHLLRRHLEPQYRKTRRPVVQYYVIKPLVSDLVTVLSVLAQSGNDAPDKVSAAFRAGFRGLNVPEVEPRPLELARANLAELDAALGRLAQATPALKRQILQACADTVAADGRVAAREAELLRAIADGLDCPLPPFLALR